MTGGRGRALGSVLAPTSALGAVLVLHHTGLGWVAILRAALGAALMFFPLGDLLLPRAEGTLGRGERITLAFGVGYPAAATLYYACALFGLRLPFRFIWAVVALAAAIRRWRWPRADEASVSTPAIRVAVAVLVPLLLWILMRDAIVFVSTPQGLLYDYATDYPDHMAYYWELLRGFPPRQIPTAAGLPAGSYHVLGFMPGLFLLREMGLDVIALHHVMAPALRLLLLMGGLYVAVRVYTGRALLAVATLVSVFCVSLALGNATEGRIVDAASPFSFFMTSESGGAAIVVWTTIAALLLLRERLAGREARRVLILASALAGLSYGFKAQTFLLMGAAYGLALVAVWIRDRHRDLPLALLVMAAAAGFVFFSWRAPLNRGTPLFTPGLFAALYVRPALQASRLGALGATVSAALDHLPATAAGLVETAIGVWRMAGLSVLLLGWLVHVARRWRTAGLAENTLALSPVLALPLGYAFSVRAMDGAVSPYEFIQAAQGLAFLAGAVNVVALWALLARVTPRAASWTLAIVAAAATAVVPILVTGKTLRTPHRDVVLSTDEACALLYLRDLTPLDSVVAIARGDGVPPGSRRLNYHPIVAGLAGRRSVLEYFWREVDPAVDRVHALRRLFDTSDGAEGEALLRRFGVTHVVEYAGRPLRFTSPALVPVYRHGGVTVYRFGPERPGGPPEGIPPAFGLTCAPPPAATS